MKFLNPDWEVEQRKNWIAAAIGAVTAVACMVSGRKAAKAQAAAMAAQQRTADEQLAFSKQQYQDYKDTYGDLEESMVAEVEEWEPDESKEERYRGEATADTAMAFDKAQEASKREMQRYGMDPSQARFQESEAEMGRGRALAEATNLTRASRQAEAEQVAEADKMFARKLAVGQFGKGIAGSASAVANASKVASDVSGGHAGIYGDQASDAFKSAGQGMKSVGYWANQSQPSNESYAMSGPSYGSWDTTTTDASGYNQSDPDTIFG